MEEGKRKDYCGGSVVPEHLVQYIGGKRVRASWAMRREHEQLQLWGLRIKDARFFLSFCVTQEKVTQNCWLHVANEATEPPPVIDVLGRRCWCRPSETGVLVVGSKDEVAEASPVALHGVPAFMHCSCFSGVTEQNARFWALADLSFVVGRGRLVSAYVREECLCDDDVWKVVFVEC